jgi:hypothetical protein
MERNIEHRYAIKFCIKLKETATETFEKLKRAYGDEVLSIAQVFRWHKAFKEGRENVEDEHRSGRPSTVKSDENVERVRSLVATDRRLTVRLVENELNMNKNADHQILTDNLDMRKVSAKMVPKNCAMARCLSWSFWPLNKFPFSHSHPTLQIWLPVTFSYSRI